jgi:predicted lysophospholipase L1 biosynthesis ABC-type transport system permease subunit
MLKTGLGGVVTVRDEAGRDVRLRIVALLRDSVFQGELLIADAAFRRMFPRAEGYTLLLIDPAGRLPEARDWLALAYADRGLVIRDAHDRLQAFLQVENTYLSTFQILGGFGLLLGTLGLAVVMLRNVWERRREFALMRAVGYRGGQLAEMVVAENVALVLFGLGVGVAAAALAVGPAGGVAAAGAPWSRLVVLLGGAAVCGIAAGAAAVRSTLRAPLLPALRRE